MTNIIEKAARLAVEGHGGQIRKSDDSPYLVHPIMVALMLQKHGFSDVVVAAGLAHDLLEVTEMTEQELKNELGNKVTEIVQAVSNDDSLAWEDKKKQYIESVRNGPEGAKAVCVADKIHNLESLLVAYEKQGPELWKRFNRGKDKKIWFETEVLKMLKETWDHPMIAEYEALLGKEKSLK